MDEIPITVDAFKEWYVKNYPDSFLKISRDFSALRIEGYTVLYMYLSDGTVDLKELTGEIQCQRFSKKFNELLNE